MSRKKFVARHRYHDCGATIVAMGRREQEMIDQMRQWRSESDARPEPPWTDPSSPRRATPPRQDRLADARARRAARLTVPDTDREPHFITNHGITLVHGPAHILEVAWQSNTAIQVRGSTGAYYTVKLAAVTKPDYSGMCIGHPAGSLADRNRVVRLERAGDTKGPKIRRAKRRRNHGATRGSRSR